MKERGKPLFASLAPLVACPSSASAALLPERVPEARRRRRGADINRAPREEAPGHRRGATQRNATQRDATLRVATPTSFAPLVVSRLDARHSRIPGTRRSRASLVAAFFFTVVRPLGLLVLLLLLRFLFLLLIARIRKSHVSDALPARFPRCFRPRRTSTRISSRSIDRSFLDWPPLSLALHP